MASKEEQAYVKLQDILDLVAQLIATGRYSSKEIQDEIATRFGRE